MVEITRRSMLTAGASLVGTSMLPPAIARAAAIDPDIRTGTIRDIDHVVILMQENRGFDHYFGTMRGVRGFADRFPIPLAPSAPEDPIRSAWQQSDRVAPSGPRLVSPFHLDTRADFGLMRVAGTPHTWPDAQRAWDEGRMGHWPEYKHQRTMGYFARGDMPFQFALAEAFTLCDAYHCSIQAGTNPNRLFLWSGTNDPGGRLGGPAIANSHDDFPANGGAVASYRWTTVPERLSAAGIDWLIYQDMADNYTDNPLVGFAAYRAAFAGHGDPDLKRRALTTRGLDALRADALAGRLPQVSYIIATAAGCEHPSVSSPAQGAAYVAEVLDALTADPKIWARTALFVMFDENDGFFDHVPPPAPPSVDGDRTFGASTVDLAGEYHLVPSSGDADVDVAALRGRPYGLGPRVPMYVASPWSRGGWIASEVFDHTSVIRFLEARFGFHEPNISPWRRAICGDLTATFDFTRADVTLPAMPDIAGEARRAAALKGQPEPLAPEGMRLWQEPGIRPARPTGYRAEIAGTVTHAGFRLRFFSPGRASVFHVYDRLNLGDPPRRYTLDMSSGIEGVWPLGPDDRYDLWVIGPNNFHRRFAGTGAAPSQLADVQCSVDADGIKVTVPDTPMPLDLNVVRRLPGGGAERVSGLHAGSYRWPTANVGGWYDLTLLHADGSAWLRRVAGRHDRIGIFTISDPFIDELA